ncbi:MAG: response regulator [Myxococcales bacterium]|nr:response regulator [Myxococcales bacterium]MCB9713821.1 response regulator [Myxococcales bacterium]
MITPIPVESAEGPPRRAGPEPELVPSATAYRVLVADDNLSIHDDFSRIFAAAETQDDRLDELAASLFDEERPPAPAGPRFTLEHVTQGRDALTRVLEARDAERPYALVFMDVRMPPGWDGVETAAHVLEADPDVRVVLCTAYSERTWRKRVEALRGRDRLLVLKKPFDALEVHQLACALCERWAMVRRDRDRVLDLERSVSEQRGELAAATAHLRSEIENRTQAENLLRKAQRLEGLGRLAAGLCHEINNPLSFIVTSTELIEHELEALQGRMPEGPHAELSELIGAISVGASRIAQLVRNIKLFARHSEATAELIAIDEVVDSALGMLRHRLRGRAELLAEIPAGALVLGRRIELEQVLVNLVENALHAMGSQQVPAPRIWVGARRDERRVSVAVVDNGPGIDLAIIDKIFDPFFTTKSVGAGTGLGLSICHTLVTGMGGTIDVRNNEGRGVTFTISLPAAPRPEPGRAMPVDDEVTGPLADPGRPGRILVVDDEPLVLSMLRRTLQPHQIDTVSCVPDALARCSRERYDLILCDIMMPGLDGCDFYRLLAQLRPGAESRIVFITGGGSLEGVQRFLDRIPNRHIDKPFDSRALRRLVGEEVMRRRAATDSATV